GGQNWQTGTGGSFTLAEGTYANVQVRQTDAAGNTATTTLGAITVDASVATPVAALTDDTGVLDDDGITSNGQIDVTGLEDGATWEFTTDGGQNWQTGTGGSFTLAEGTYANVQVRQTDAAGNTATTTLGQVVVDATVTGPLAALAVDSGTSASDRITNNGLINVTGLEAGATWQYSTNGGQTWLNGTGGSFTLTEGTYANVQVRQTDVAGNTATTTLGQVVVDATIATPTVALAVDTGTSATDGITNNGLVNVTGLESGATWQYSTNGGQTWLNGTGGSFTLTEGTYANVQVRQTDVAGNTASTTLGQIVVDTTIVAPNGVLNTDTGTSNTDRITSDGRINVSGVETGASWQYSTNGGQTWINGTGTSFTLPQGVYSNVQLRQTDLAGNVSSGRALTAFTIASPDAVNDLVSLNMGLQARVVNPSQTDTDVEVVGLLQSDIGVDNSVSITVRPDQVGDVRIVVSQTALVAVGDAFRLDVLDAQGNIVYSAVTQNSLLGDVAGLPVLGVLGNNTLVANVPGLLPGQYSVVVRNDESTLEQLLDTNGGGVSLQELGSAGVVVGPNNQAVILGAVDNALGGPVATLLLTPLLNSLNGSSVAGVVGALSNVLNTLGLSALLDGVIGAVADALLSNTLTALQATSITTTVTEFDFANEAVGGNVITGQGGVGADNLAGGASVSLITHANGSSSVVSPTGTTQITGEHGVLQISANGTYSYTAFGDPASIGQSDVFTYTLSDGTVSDTATLTVQIDGTTVLARGDTASASVSWAFQTADLVTANNANISVVGTPTYTSNSFTVTSSTVLTGEVSVFLTAGAFVTGNLYIERQGAGGVWAPVKTVGYNTSLGLLSTVAQINLANENLSAGTYRIRATLGGTLSVANVNANIDATYTNQFLINGRSGATGNILTNDELGSTSTQLQIFSPTAGEYVPLSAGTSMTIQGTYGSLLINADGSYTYTVGSGFGHFTSARIDSFDYQLVHPNNQTSEGSLDVSVQPTGAGVPVVTSSFAADSNSENIADLLEYSMLEDQGSLEDVLENYLRASEAPAEEPVDNIPEPVQSPDDVKGPPDDLDYLNDPNSDPLSEDQNGHYLI
ncbi:beta strand repeat-containing protein, partial [Croceibacterium xixiisoli]|uniref:beta strand repeat-containing protein n=1 Tax=Croceibacterium xixiisoli TaxID=1476466 RepID=UPI001925EE35